ncbi:MAG: dienelactone hydrolase family protein [Candidatus Binatia bacterium]
MEIVSLPVAYKSDDATIESYLSFPKTGSRCPGVLVLSERYGLVEYVKDVCRRLAREGYTAIAPEMRSRQGCDELIQRSYDMIAVKDCTEAIQYLQSLDFVQPEQIGVIGFCWGGYVAGLLACLDPAVRATVIFYGTTHSERSVRHPVSVPELAGSWKGPLLGLYAEIDRHPTLEDVKELEEALKKHRKSFEFKIYPGAKHGFHNDSMPERYNAEAAEDGWRRTLDFLKGSLR